MNQEFQPAESIARLQKLLSNLKVCFLSTVDPDGRLSSRPMYTVRIDGDGNAWFFTHERSEKTREAEDSGKAWLHYGSEADNTYVIAEGTVTVVDDRETLSRFWTPVLKAWYPDGLETPDLCLLKVKLEQAQYWDGSGSKVVNAFQLVKAIVTGTPATAGEEGKLHL